jgi:ABC-type transport system involved in multi-copper enzyme maturation permease subunit
MKKFFSELPAVHPFLIRELRTILRNRFLQVFSALALLAGGAAVVSGPSPGALPYIYLQLILYLVPLFTALIGISSAHGELEEHQFLFSQPLCRFHLVLGKWSALFIVSAAILFLTFLPALLSGTAPLPLLALWGKSLGLASVFIGLGLAVGFSTHDRSRGLIYVLTLWLLLLIGFDLAAYFAAQFPAVHHYPAAWFFFLLTNPIDAVRITALFALQEIPFTIPGENKWVAQGVGHLGKWVVVLTLAWTLMLLFWCRRQVEKKEV